MIYNDDTNYVAKDDSVVNLQAIVLVLYTFDHLIDPKQHVTSLPNLRLCLVKKKLDLKTVFTSTIGIWQHKVSTMKNFNTNNFSIVGSKILSDRFNEIVLGICCSDENNPHYQIAIVL